jgi:Rrp15p
MNTSKSIIKREKNRRYGKKSKSNATSDPLESIDRFAGSSEEEDNDDDDGDNTGARITTAVDNEIEPNNKDNKAGLKRTGTPIHNTSLPADEYEGGNESESDNESEDDDEEEDDDENAERYNEIEQQFQLTTGMANAMNRILSAPTKSKTSSIERTPNAIVLSKTKTPLQIQAEKEKKLQESLKESRRVKRERQIRAIHIPLTVATNSFAALNSSTNPASSSLTKELENERMHRRVATRGIVALFNAIAHHQVRPDQTALAAAAAATAAASTTNTENKSKKSTANSASTKLTKNGFLDLIKQKAITSASLYDAKTPKSVVMKSNTQEHEGTQTGTKKWNALKDEYMMDSTRNWDELDDDETEGMDMGTKSTPPRKKIRHDSRN